MAKVRFIAPETRDVPWLGRTVQPDEVVEVPDAQYDSYVCQPEVWVPVEEPKTVKTPAPKSAKEGA